MRRAGNPGMRYLLALGMVVFSVSMLGAAPASRDATLNVEVTGLRSREGHLRLGVFKAAEGFPEERTKAVLWRTLPANSKATNFRVDLPPGRYAVVILHDENGNKKMDRNLLGVPKEGYGVTNNPKPKRRAARFDEALFELTGDGKSMRVSVQYF